MLAPCGGQADGWLGPYIYIFLKVFVFIFLIVEHHSHAVHLSKLEKGVFNAYK